MRWVHLAAVLEKDRDEVENGVLTTPRRNPIGVVELAGASPRRAEDSAPSRHSPCRGLGGKNSVQIICVQFFIMNQD